MNLVLSSFASCYGCGAVYANPLYCAEHEATCVLVPRAPLKDEEDVSPPPFMM